MPHIRRTDIAAAAASVPHPAADSAASGSSLYGQFPPLLLEPLVDHVRQLTEAQQDLGGMTRSLGNAYALYLKTRPSARYEVDVEGRCLEMSMVCLRVYGSCIGLVMRVLVLVCLHCCTLAVLGLPDGLGKKASADAHVRLILRTHLNTLGRQAMAKLWDMS
jgi:hypothetical protein